MHNHAQIINVLTEAFSTQQLTGEGVPLTSAPKTPQIDTAKQQPKNPNALVTNEHLQTLASNLGPWKQLADVLGISKGEAYRLQQESKYDAWAQVHNMLYKWKGRAYPRATIGHLVKKCRQANIDFDMYAFLLDVS